MLLLCRHREEATVVGSLPSVAAGEWLTAEGWWVRDKEHGLQFKATAMKTVPPTTAEGIERYLSSGLVKGIGPVLAKRLVGRFGAEVFDLDLVDWALRLPGDILLPKGAPSKHLLRTMCADLYTLAIPPHRRSKVNAASRLLLACGGWGRCATPWKRVCVR